MKKITLAVAAASILFTGAASAADLRRPAVKAPPPVVAPIYSWTGFYIGVNGGWAFDGWSDSTGDLIANTGLAGQVAAGTVPRFLGANHEGGFGGGQIGYNWQMNQFVLGVEADIQAADIGKTNTFIVPPVGIFVQTTNTGRDHIDWFGTARVRLGLAANTALFYVTGGAAYGGVNSSASVVGTPPGTGTFVGSFSDTRFGWAAGAGVEWAFAPNWSVKAEYLHVDLGSDNVVIADPAFPGFTATYRFHHEFDAVRVGLNYKWGGGPVVAKY
jgi:outer membrane immunogenic protein